MVFKPAAGIGPMSCLWAASAGLLVVANACDSYDASLLTRMAASATSHGPLDGGNHVPGSTDAALMRPDARTPGLADAAGGTAGTAGMHDSGSTITAMPSMDAGSHEDSGVTSTDSGQRGDSGSQDSGPNDGGPTDSGQAPCTPTTVSSYCAQIPALPAAPIIDGALDCGPELMLMSPVGWNGSGSLPASPTTSVAAAWRAGGLYVYVEVRGQAATPHPSGSRIDCGDAVEIYIDHDGTMSGSYDTPGTMQLIVAAPSASAAGTIEAARYNGNPHGAWSVQAPSGLATARFADGYAIEAFITAADLDLTAWAPSAGASIGFDVTIDVSGTPYRTSSGCPATGGQRGQYFMRVSTASGGCSLHEPYCDDRSFCPAQLL